MHYFKKFPVFFGLIALLLLAFAGGIAFNAAAYFDEAKAQKKLKNARADFDAALAEDPTQKAIDDVRENIKKLEEHLAFLEKDLPRARDDIFSAPPSEPYQLVEQLRGLVQKWKRSAASKQIALQSDMDFGFKRYVEPNAEPPEEAAVAPIWKQACVLNYIMGKFFDCKTEESPMAVVSVQREVLAEESGANKADNRRMTTRDRRARARLAAIEAADDKGDNFAVDPNITARKKGSISTLAYKFNFAGHTDVLRRFLNKLKDFDAMLVVRSISVKPADQNVNEILNKKPAEEGMEGLDEVFGNNKEKEKSEGENAENAEKKQEQSEEAEKIKTPVVSDNLSVFSVVIEYAEVVKEPEAKKEVKSKEE